MKKEALLAAVFSVLASVSLAAERTSFDRDWRFRLGDVPNGQQPDLNVADWRSLDVPHDWSIEGPVGRDPKTMDGPFDAKSPAGASGGYLNAGTAWYRKTWTLPESARGKRVFIEFDGVYMDSDVWINGVHMGNHPYGYTSFRYDLTPHVKPGQPNVLAVRVAAKQACSRWYSGAGIYRHVWLTLADPVHVAHWGTYVTTPEITDAAAKVRVRTRIENQGSSAAKVELNTVIRDPSGGESGRQATSIEIPAGGAQELDQTLAVSRPQRWSIETPVLYTAATEVRVAGQLVDTCTTPFGIRTIEFTADRGFLLNGRRVQLKGVCNHHDLGCLGAAVHRRAIERQLEILKAMGCNAIRTSHNPPAPELLDLCDRMGFVVMDEAFDEWKSNKVPQGYGRFFDQWSERDLTSMIRRDRNHPCVIAWSIGNEINEQNSKNGGAMAKRLADICRREDPTRPVTSGCNYTEGAVHTGYAKALDVFGINYNIDAYKRYRGKVLVASETASAVSSRGEYGLALNAKGEVEIRRQFNNHVTSYDLMFPQWACTAETSLKALRDAPWVAGEFVWTGFDYLGEPTPYGWPSRSSYFGIVDLCGFPKDRYWLYKSQWTDQPVVHLLPHWNWEQFAGKAIPVWCFTNAESVELFSNGKSQGEKKMIAGGSLHLEWKVPYEPGTLKAVGKRSGQVVATYEVHTAGKPARLVLLPDRKRIAADGQDLSFVEVRVVDAQGRVCPNADNLVRFTISGPGVIAGVDNGDATNHEPFQADRHKAYHGLCLAVVRASHEPGEVKLTAAAEGLEGAEATITAATP